MSGGDDGFAVVGPCVVGKFVGLEVGLEDGTSLAFKLGDSEGRDERAILGGYDDVMLGFTFGTSAVNTLLLVAPPPEPSSLLLSSLELSSSLIGLPAPPKPATEMADSSALLLSAAVSLFPLLDSPNPNPTNTTSATETTPAAIKYLRLLIDDSAVLLLLDFLLL